MFDVGFWELLFIFTLALIVLGPDKLPAVVSTLGRWTGRARALARGLRVQIERELAADQTTWKPPPKADVTPPPAAAPQPHVPGGEAARADDEATRAAGAAFEPDAAEGAEPAAAAPEPPSKPGPDAPAAADRTAAAPGTTAADRPDER